MCRRLCSDATPALTVQPPKPEAQVDLGGETPYYRPDVSDERGRLFSCSWDELASQLHAARLSRSHAIMHIALEFWFKLVSFNPLARRAMLCPFCKVERSKRFWKPSQWRSWSATAGEFNCCSECDISCYKPTMNMEALLASSSWMNGSLWAGAP